jgi:hypothetical protein
MRFSKPLHLFFPLLAALIHTATADIIYLASCNQAGNPFAAVIFYYNAPNGNQAPEGQNIAVVANSQGQTPWGIIQYTLYGYFFVTNEIFTVPPLNGAAPRYSFAGNGYNSGGSWNCYKDNGSGIFDDGTYSCNRDYYCLPVSVESQRE